MLGTIIALSAQEITLEFNSQLYTLKLSVELANEPLRIGQFVDFTLNSQGELATIKAHKLLSQKIYISQDNTVDNGILLEINTKVTLVSEGKSVITAFKNFEAEALKHNANAIFNYKLDVIKRPFAKKFLYRLTGNLGQIKSDSYPLTPGLKLKINENQARVNFANDALIRYYRVLLICMLLIVIPCIFSLGAQQVLFNLGTAKVISFILVIIVAIIAYILNPRTNKIFFKRPRHGLF